LPVEGKKGGEEGEAAVGCKTFGLCAGAKGKATMETIIVRCRLRLGTHEGTSERSDKTGRVANRNKARKKNTGVAAEIEIWDVDFFGQDGQEEQDDLDCF
jgi:hypothetical protein